MRWGGREAPRKKEGVGGWVRRWAQSRGEWAGARRTFLEGRLVGRREEVEGARERVGARRVEAEEGGERMVESVVGMGRRFVVLLLVVVGVGGGGGAICEGVGGCGFRFEVVVGRGGGGIGVGWLWFWVRLRLRFVEGLLPGAVMLADEFMERLVGIAGLSPSLRVKVGSGAESVVVVAIAFGVVCADASSWSESSRKPLSLKPDDESGSPFSLRLSFGLVPSSVCCSSLV